MNLGENCLQHIKLLFVRNFCTMSNFFYSFEYFLLGGVCLLGRIQGALLQQSVFLRVHHVTLFSLWFEFLWPVVVLDDSTHKNIYYINSANLNKKIEYLVKIFDFLYFYNNRSPLGLYFPAIIVPMFITVACISGSPSLSLRRWTRAPERRRIRKDSLPCRWSGSYRTRMKSALATSWRYWY